MESASTGASSSAHPSAVSAIPNSLARTAGRVTAVPGRHRRLRAGAAVCLSGPA
jgi:hypothetical protein